MTLTCAARGSPTPVITWRREGNDPITLPNGREGNGVLINLIILLLLLPPGDGVHFKCRPTVHSSGRTKPPVSDRESVYSPRTKPRVCTELAKELLIYSMQKRWAVELL